MVGIPGYNPTHSMLYRKALSWCVLPFLPLILCETARSFRTLIQAMQPQGAVWLISGKHSAVKGLPPLGTHQICPINPDSEGFSGKGKKWVLWWGRNLLGVEPSPSDLLIVTRWLPVPPHGTFSTLSCHTQYLYLYLHIHTCIHL